MALASQRLRPDLVALCATLSLILTRVLTPADLPQLLAEPAVVDRGHAIIDAGHAGGGADNQRLGISLSHPPATRRNYCHKSRRIECFGG